MSGDKKDTFRPFTIVCSRVTGIYQHLVRCCLCQTNQFDVSEKFKEVKVLAFPPVSTWNRCRQSVKKSRRLNWRRIEMPFSKAKMHIAKAKDNNSEKNTSGEINFCTGILEIVEVITSICVFCDITMGGGFY